MRALMLVAGAALLLSACGGDSAADDASNADGNLAAEDIVVNDTTAIDAALGADANMAADVEINLPANEADNAGIEEFEKEAAGNGE